eukprot:1811248-Rhodomonas_salina.2
MERVFEKVGDREACHAVDPFQKHHPARSQAHLHATASVGTGHCAASASVCEGRKGGLCRVLSTSLSEAEQNERNTGKERHGRGAAGLTVGRCQVRRVRWTGTHASAPLSPSIPGQITPETLPRTLHPQ